MTQGWAREQGLSWQSRACVCECEQVHRLYGEIINLVTQLKTESAPIRAVGFT